MNIWLYKHRKNKHHIFFKSRVSLPELNALLSAGCPWRLLPHDFPVWQTVYEYFRNWRSENIWAPINRQLSQWVRVSGGKEATPSMAITNSQSVQIDSIQSESQAVGCDAGKKVKGRKRHILVDTWGLLMVVVVTAANIAEREGAKLVLAKSQSYYLDCLRFLPMLVMIVCQCSNELWILIIGAGRLSNAPIRRLVLYLCLNARWSNALLAGLTGLAV